MTSVANTSAEHNTPPAGFSSWLAFADAVAAQEQERRAAREANRLPDYERDMAELKRTVEARRAEPVTPKIERRSLTPQEEQNRYIDALPEGYRTTLLQKDADGNEKYSFNERWETLYAWQQVAYKRAGMTAEEHAHLFCHSNRKKEPVHYGHDLDGLIGLPSIPHEVAGKPQPPLDPADFSLDLRIHLHIQAGLNKAGLRDAAFLYWIVQHRKRTTGRDKFTVSELQSYLYSLGILSWNERRIHEAITHGKGLLFREDHPDPRDRRVMVYAMIGKKWVMLALGITDAGRRVQIPDRAWRGSLRTWQAFCWDAFVTNHKHNGDWARATLAAEYGISRRTSQGYEYLTGLRAEPQIAGGEVSTNAAVNAEMDQRKRPFSWHKVQTWQRGRRRYGRKYLVWQDVNVYRSTSTQPMQKGRRRHLSRQVKALAADNARNGDVPAAAANVSDYKPIRRFDDGKRANDYRKHEPTQPALRLFQKQTPRALQPRGNPVRLAFEYMPSRAALGAVCHA